MQATEPLKSAISLALAGAWEQSHRIVQEYDDPLACWIHAVLHKIEGDAWNSRYWYKRANGAQYEDFDSPEEELRKIAQRLG